MVYVEFHLTMPDAIPREKQIKKMAPNVEAAIDRREQSAVARSLR
jgi:predicted GIY-YIG superfamily endonuclease